MAKMSQRELRETITRLITEVSISARVDYLKAWKKSHPDIFQKLERFFLTGDPDFKAQLDNLAELAGDYAGSFYNDMHRATLKVKLEGGNYVFYRGNKLLNPRNQRALNAADRQGYGAFARMAEDMGALYIEDSEFGEDSQIRSVGDWLRKEAAAEARRQQADAQFYTENPDEDDDFMYDPYYADQFTEY